MTREVTLVGHFGWWAGFLRGRLFNIFLSTHTYDNTPMHTRTYILRAHDINGYERLNPFIALSTQGAAQAGRGKHHAKRIKARPPPPRTHPNTFFSECGICRSKSRVL